VTLRGAAITSHAKQTQGTRPGVRTGDGWSAPYYGRLTPGREKQYPLYKRLGGRTAGLGRCGKCCLAPRFARRTVQPVASRYTGNGVNATQLFVCSLQQYTLNYKMAQWRPSDGFFWSGKRTWQYSPKAETEKTVFWDIIHQTLFRRRLLYAVCFLLGNSPTSAFYMPAFRNTLFHLHRQVGVKNELDLGNFGVFIWEKVWIEPNVFQYKYSNISRT
jgi:hypothetical protein